MNEYLEYSDKEHRYFADGRERMSVTQILDAAGLISPFCKTDEEARERGTAVHALCAQDDIEKIDLKAIRGHKGYLEAWRKYREDAGFTPTLIEHRVDDAIAGYAGRFDRLGMRRGQTLRTLLDIKTSKVGMVASYVNLQLIAYCHAFDPGSVFERIAVALKPDGTYKCAVYSIESYYADRDEWLGLVRQVRAEMESPGTGVAFEEAAYA